MRVFNLTEKPLDYRGRTIPPDGGYLDFPDMDFIPDRDLRLQQERILSFGRLPHWFETQRRIRRVADLADEVTGEIRLNHTPIPGTIPILGPEDIEEIRDENTLVPVPVSTSKPLVEKKLGRVKTVKKKVTL